ncbi:hypothetical protein M8J75_006632 [Diaphorina citri]|nr:hypothetical protein M8J75_006632 [Diaphorina citri]
MGEKAVIFTGVCFLALAIICLARPQEPVELTGNAPNPEILIEEPLKPEEATPNDQRERPRNHRHWGDRPLYRRDEHNDISYSNETPDAISNSVNEHQRANTLNEDELENDAQETLERRQQDGLTGQQTSGQVSDAGQTSSWSATEGVSNSLATGASNFLANGGVPPNFLDGASNFLANGGVPPNLLANGIQIAPSDPQQIQELKDILNLEMNNKDTFAQVYAQMTPEQVKKVRDIVLKIGQQTNNQDLIRFGQCTSPRFSTEQVNLLLKLGQALYQRLNQAGDSAAAGVRSAVNQFSNTASQVDTREILNQVKAQISGEQDFVRRLVNMIELQLSQAPQIDDTEFAQLKQIIERIKTLGAQVQTQLQTVTDLSQISEMRGTLLEIQQLASQIQQKVSAELSEEKIRELVNNAFTATQTATNTGNSVRLSVRDSGDVVDSIDVVPSSFPEVTSTFSSPWTTATPPLTTRSPFPEVTSTFSSPLTTATLPLTTRSPFPEVTSTFSSPWTTATPPLTTRSPPPPPPRPQRPTFIIELQNFLKRLEKFFERFICDRLGLLGARFSVYRSGSDDLTPDDLASLGFNLALAGIRETSQATTLKRRQGPQLAGFDAESASGTTDSDKVSTLSTKTETDTSHNFGGDSSFSTTSEQEGGSSQDGGQEVDEVLSKLKPPQTLSGGNGASTTLVKNEWTGPSGYQTQTGGKKIYFVIQQSKNKDQSSDSEAKSETQLENYKAVQKTQIEGELGAQAEKGPKHGPGNQNGNNGPKRVSGKRFNQENDRLNGRPRPGNRFVESANGQRQRPGSQINLENDIPQYGPQSGNTFYEEYYGSQDGQRPNKRFNGEIGYERQENDFVQNNEGQNRIPKNRFNQEYDGQEIFYEENHGSQDKPRPNHKFDQEDDGPRPRPNHSFNQENDGEERRQDKRFNPENYGPPRPSPNGPPRHRPDNRFHQENDGQDKRFDPENDGPPRPRPNHSFNQENDGEERRQDKRFNPENDGPPRPRPNGPPRPRPDNRFHQENDGQDQRFNLENDGPPRPRPNHRFNQENNGQDQRFNLENDGPPRPRPNRFHEENDEQNRERKRLMNQGGPQGSQFAVDETFIRQNSNTKSNRDDALKYRDDAGDSLRLSGIGESQNVQRNGEGHHEEHRQNGQHPRHDNQGHGNNNHGQRKCTKSKNKTRTQQVQENINSLSETSSGDEGIRQRVTNGLESAVDQGISAQLFNGVRPARGKEFSSVSKIFNGVSELGHAALGTKNQGPNVVNALSETESSAGKSANNQLTGFNGAKLGSSTRKVVNQISDEERKKNSNQNGKKAESNDGDTLKFRAGAVDNGRLSITQGNNVQSNVEGYQQEEHQNHGHRGQGNNHGQRKCTKSKNKKHTQQAQENINSLSETSTSDGKGVRTQISNGFEAAADQDSSTQVTQGINTQLSNVIRLAGGKRLYEIPEGFNGVGGIESSTGKAVNQLTEDLNEVRPLGSSAEHVKNQVSDSVSTASETGLPGQAANNILYENVNEVNELGYSAAQDAKNQVSDGVNFISETGVSTGKAINNQLSEGLDEGSELGSLAVEDLNNQVSNDVNTASQTGDYARKTGSNQLYKGFTRVSKLRSSANVRNQIPDAIHVVSVSDLSTGQAIDNQLSASLSQVKDQGQLAARDEQNQVGSSARKSGDNQRYKGFTRVNKLGSSIANNVRNQIPNYVNMVGESGKAINKQLAEGFNEARDQGNSAASDVNSLLSNGVNTDSESGIIEKAVNQLSGGETGTSTGKTMNQLYEGFNKIRELKPLTGENVKEKVSNGVNTVSKSGISTGKTINKQLAEGFNEVGDQGYSVASDLNNQLSDGVNKVSESGKAASDVKNQVTNDANTLGESGIIGKAVNQVSEGFNEVRDQGYSVASDVNSQVSNVVNTVNETGSSTGNQVSDDINAATESGSSVMTEIKGGLADGSAVKEQGSTSSTGDEN